MTLSTLDPNTALIVIDLQKGIIDLPAIHPIADVAGHARALAVNRLATATPPNLLPNILTMLSKMDFRWGHNRRRLWPHSPRISTVKINHLKRFRKASSAGADLHQTNIAPPATSPSPPGARWLALRQPRETLISRYPSAYASSST